MVVVLVVLLLLLLLLLLSPVSDVVVILLLFFFIAPTLPLFFPRVCIMNIILRQTRVKTTNNPTPRTFLARIESSPGDNSGAVRG